MAVDDKYGIVTVPGIPDDEPVVIFRAQDICVPELLDQYRFIYLNLAPNSRSHLEGRITDEDIQTFADRIEKLSNKFNQWQDEHDDKVKVPD